jgi:hypothetical protein
MTYSIGRLVAFFLLGWVSAGTAGEAAPLEVGVAVRDVTPELPIRLAGYAARQRPADRVALPLRATALALRDRSGARFVFVGLDNCAVSHAFMQPVLERLTGALHLERGAVAVVSSHTHSAPVLTQSLVGMPQAPPEDREAIAKYSRSLQARLMEVVAAALDDLKPAWLEYGAGRAGFAMNRRAFHGDKVDLGENPDGPVDWDVPVLRVKGTNGAVRAIVFGYACHGTSIQNGDDWYAVCSDYMGYARQLIEAHQPGATALYLTGMGADANPSPRGRLLNAQRHGLELAGAVMGVLDRPMRPVSGGLKLAFDEVELPLAEPPSREQLEKDAQSRETAVRQRAGLYLKRLEAGQPLPRAVSLPLAALRLGDDLTFVLMGGEVVVDYSRRLKRLLAEDHPWMVGYAYEVPCYIPSARVLKEGGYEAEASLQYYGFYGPLRTSIEDLLVNRATAMVAGLKAQ